MNLTVKQRYFDKIYANALIINCGCGCGIKLKNKDKYGRGRKYISGHNNRKYDDPKQYKREWNKRNSQSKYESKVKRGHRLKVKVIYILGNKCDDCGLSYNGQNACIFQVHHRDPKKKKFVVNTRTLINYAWIKVLTELNKCILLCANCHFVKHNEEY